MRMFLFPLACICAAAEAKSQLPSTLDSANARPQIYSKRLLAEGTYSHTTSRGKVYNLPYDNMPCLVPNMNTVAPMPGSIERYPESRMPNAIPRRPLLPKQKDSAQ